jgi:signal transduction histidine kinase
LTKYKNANERPVGENAIQERSIQFTRELFHEFANMLTAVIGYSELALHTIEDSHPAREWLEKACKHTKELAALLRKLIPIKHSKKGE